MTAEWTPDDAPAVRARVPSHVADGQLGTGVIVVTGPTEFVFDFVRNLPRPSVICARVILPHNVMPQFIQALERNLELYRQRYGSYPGPGDVSPPTLPHVVRRPKGSDVGGSIDVLGGSIVASPSDVVANDIGIGPKPPDVPPLKIADDPEDPQSDNSSQESSQDLGRDATSKSAARGAAAGETTGQNTLRGESSLSGGKHVPSRGGGSDESIERGENVRNEDSVRRHPSPHEVYDELKLRDELLSGAYANAVMIGHGQHEFSFDFITNFYPQSAVSARVYLASGHVVRMLESMRVAWFQLRDRFEPPASSGN